MNYSRMLLFAALCTGYAHMQGMMMRSPEKRRLVALIGSVGANNHQQVLKLINNPEYPLSPNVRIPRYDNATLLIHAASRNHNDTVAALLTCNDIEIDATDNNGETALAIALKNHNYEIAEILLAHHADPNIRVNGDPLLLHAIKSNNETGVGLLLEHGANPNALDRMNKSIFLTALIKRNVPIITFMLEFDADPNVTDISGLSTIAIAIDEEIFDQDDHAKEKTVEIVKLLLEYGADPNAKDNEDCSLLNFAIGFEQNEIAILLIKAGADLNQGNADGITPFMESISFNNVPFAMELINLGAKINQADNETETALHYAIRVGNPEMIRLLLLSGANCEYKSSYTQPNTNTQIKHTPLMLATKYDDHPRENHVTFPIEILLAHKPELWRTDNNGNTALHLALQNNAPKKAKAIIWAATCFYPTQTQPLFDALNQEGKKPIDYAADATMRELLANPTEYIKAHQGEFTTIAHKIMKEYSLIEAAQIKQGKRTPHFDRVRKREAGGFEPRKKARI